MLSNALTIIVMGVCGCGKSSVAKRLAQHLGAHFKDGDALHSKANIQRMSAGLALRDCDRLPWLNEIAHYARERTESGQHCVIACSALKKSYRDILNNAGKVLYLYLDGSPQLILSRLQQRQGHFMPEDLLESQFATLEVPRADAEQVVVVDITADLDCVVHKALEKIKSHHLYR